jgi:hypothetical protein
LFLLQFGLLLEFVDPLPLSDFVVADDPFPHFIIIWIHELSQDLLFLIVLLLKLFVEHFYLPDLGGELQEGGFEAALVGAVGFELFHELHVVGFHVAEDDELLGVGEYLHLDEGQIILELVFNAF